MARTRADILLFSAVVRDVYALDDDEKVLAHVAGILNLLITHNVIDQ